MSFRQQSHFRIFIDGQILLSLFLFFFLFFCVLPLTLLFRFVTRCPLAKRLFLAAGIYMPRDGEARPPLLGEDNAIPAGSRSSRVKGERRRSLETSTKRKRNDRMSSGDTSDTEKESCEYDPGGDCAPGCCGGRGVVEPGDVEP